jgi:hypothetical protein
MIAAGKTVLTPALADHYLSGLALPASDDWDAADIYRLRHHIPSADRDGSAGRNV